jgi:N-acetylmuramoyl-L-alanine amidase
MRLEDKDMVREDESVMAKVFLSAGHGGTDPGAVANSLREKDINLQILLACKTELERHGVTVVCSRVTDANDPVAEEVREANKSNADIAVSFHTNAGKGDGSETFYYSSNAKGKKLAELCEKYTKQIGQNSRGVKTGDKLYFIRKTTMPAVLCECAFVDNTKDKAIVDTVAEQKKFGVAYAKAILEYFGIKYEDLSMYRVQIGAYRNLENAEAALKKAKAAGFVNAFIDKV